MKPKKNSLEQAAMNKVKRTVLRRTVKGIVVARESDLYDMALFGGIVDQTYIPNRHIKALREIHDAGLAPMTTQAHGFFIDHETPTGATVKKFIRIERLDSGKGKAILFEHDGYLHLWAQSSAALESDRGENDFTELLCKIVKTYSPHTIFAANISRLVRAHSQADRLRLALRKRVVRIKTSDIDLKLNEPTGRLLLDTLTMVASMERNMIVQRTMTGRLYRAKNGQWPFGHGSVPVGYDLKRGTLRVDDSAESRHLVEQMMLILTSQMSDGDMHRELIELGWFSPRRTKNSDERLPIDNQSPQYFISRLYSWALLYTRGEYLLRVKNAFEDVESFANVPVSRHPSRLNKRGRLVLDPGELQVMMTVGVPPGGWAQQELLDAFEARAQLRTAEIILGLPKRMRNQFRPLNLDIISGRPDRHIHNEILSPTLANRLLSRSSANKNRKPRGGTGYAPAFHRMLWTRSGRHWTLSARSQSYGLYSWPENTPRGPLHPSPQVRLRPASQREPHPDTRSAGHASAPQDTPASEPSPPGTDQS